MKISLQNTFVPHKKQHIKSKKILDNKLSLGIYSKKNNISDKALLSASTLLGMVSVDASQKSKDVISNEELSALMKKNNYVKNEKGEYNKNIREEDVQNILNSNDWHKKSSLHLMSKYITADEMIGFKEFLEFNNGEALKYKDEHFDKLMLCYITLRRNHIYRQIRNIIKENPEYEKVVLSSINQELKTDDIDILKDYKTTGARLMNEHLRLVAKGVQSKISDSLQQKIDKLTNFLNKQKIEEPLKVYRVENEEVFFNTQTKDNVFVDVRSMMREIYENKESLDYFVNELKKFVSKENLHIKRPAFISTSISKDITGCFIGSKSVLWEIELPKGTKGLYIEPLNIDNKSAYENEFLIQRDSDFQINDIDYDKENKHWVVKAKVSN